MARKTETITTITDDLTGEELDPRVKPTEFTYRGRTYRLDLGPEGVRRLEAALQPFIDAAPAPVSAAAPASAPARATRKKASPFGDTAAIRAWAIEQGLVASGSRGRLSKDVLAAYDAAHPIR